MMNFQNQSNQRKHQIHDYGQLSSKVQQDRRQKTPSQNNSLSPEKSSSHQASLLENAPLKSGNNNSGFKTPYMKQLLQTKLQEVASQSTATNSASVKSHRNNQSNQNETSYLNDFHNIHSNSSTQSLFNNKTQQQQRQMMLNNQYHSPQTKKSNQPYFQGYNSQQSKNQSKSVSKMQKANNLSTHTPSPIKNNQKKRELSCHLQSIQSQKELRSSLNSNSYQNSNRKIQNNNNSMLNMEASNYFFAEHETLKRNSPPPRVNIQDICNKAKFFDADLQHTFDDHLNIAYNKVLSRKNDIYVQKQMNLSLRSDIHINEQTSIPVKNLLSQQKTILLANKQTNWHFQQEEKMTQEQINTFISGMDSYKEKMIQEEQELQDQIRKLNEMNIGTESEISNSKAEHTQKKKKFDELICSMEQEKVLNQHKLDQLKSEYHVMKIHQQNKKQHLINKVNMFVGIIQH